MNDAEPFEVLPVRNGLGEERFVINIYARTGTTGWYPTRLYVKNDRYLQKWVETADLYEAVKCKTRREAETIGRIFTRQQREAHWEFVPLDESVHEQIPESGTWAQQGDNAG